MPQERALAEELAPFELYESRKQPGRFLLRLGEDAMLDVADVFDEHAQYGNGFGWTAVVRQVIRARLPDLANRFRVRTDGNTWLAHAEDRAVLHRLGRELAAVYRDRALLSALISQAEPTWFE